MQHHATLYIGTSLAAIPLPEEARSPGNDVVHEIFPDLMKVEDARRIKESAARTPVEREERIVVIFAARIGTEAQNALLKLLEDPPGHTRFILVVPSVTMLLATVRSRLELQTVPLDRVPLSEEGVGFLVSVPRDRLQSIEQLHKAKDRVTMRAIITDVGHYITQHEVSAECQRVAVTALEYRDFPGASLKMWLEYLALVVPIVKNREEVLH